MTTALAGRFAVFFGEVVAERGFSSRAVFSKEARAAFERSVTDDPARVALAFAVGVDFFRFEPQSRSVGSARHSFLICSIALNVVNCLRAIISGPRPLRLSSRRSPDTVIPP